jgi:hypothetical protein
MSGVHRFGWGVAARRSASAADLHGVQGTVGGGVQCLGCSPGVFTEGLGAPVVLCNDGTPHTATHTLTHTHTHTCATRPATRAAASPRRAAAPFLWRGRSDASTSGGSGVDLCECARVCDECVRARVRARVRVGQRARAVLEPVHPPCGRHADAMQPPLNAAQSLRALTAHPTCAPSW